MKQPNTPTLTLLTMAIIVISGCSNPYSKYYHNLIAEENIVVENRIASPPKEPHLITGTNIESDDMRMAIDGYVLIGASSFNSDGVKQNAAIKQAKKVYADTVIVYCNYTNTVSGVMPLTMPNMQTSYHSGSVYGAGGSASYSGTSTTYGSTTTYMPYNVNRYDYYATYWVKIKCRLGIIYDELKDEHKKQIGSNKGIYVLAVVKGSPAFQNDIIVDDIIRKVNGVEVIDRASFSDILGKVNTAEFEIYRQGECITKKVILNP